MHLADSVRIINFGEWNTCYDDLTWRPYDQITNNDYNQLIMSEQVEIPLNSCCVKIIMHDNNIRI